MRKIGIPFEDKPIRVTVDGTVTSENTPKPRSDQDGSILDTALFNFNIAQQYIDETRYPVEHRLICFQHAMALLAKYRSPLRKDKLKLAKQYLWEVVNWPNPTKLKVEQEEARRAAGRIKFGGKSTPKLDETKTKELDQFERDAKSIQERMEVMREHSRRLVIEADYNLGVIEELLGKDPEAAYTHYRKARYSEHLKKTPRPDEFVGVELLSRFSGVVLGLRLLKQSRLNNPRDFSKGEIIRLTELLADAKACYEITKEDSVKYFNMGGYRYSVGAFSHKAEMNKQLEQCQIELSILSEEHKNRTAASEAKKAMEYDREVEITDLPEFLNENDAEA